MVLDGCGQDTSPVAATRGYAQSAAAGQQAGARGAAHRPRLHIGAQGKVLGLELFGREVKELGDAVHAGVESVAGISQLQVFDEDGESLGVLGGGEVGFLQVAFEFLSDGKQADRIGKQADRIGKQADWQSSQVRVSRRYLDDVGNMMHSLPET